MKVFDFLRTVRSLLGESQGNRYLGSCKENSLQLPTQSRYLIELRAVKLLTTEVSD